MVGPSNVRTVYKLKILDKIKTPWVDRNTLQSSIYSFTCGLWLDFKNCYYFQIRIVHYLQHLIKALWIVIPSMGSQLLLCISITVFFGLYVDISY